MQSIVFCFEDRDSLSEIRASPYIYTHEEVDTRNQPYNRTLVKNGYLRIHDYLEL